MQLGGIGLTPSPLGEHFSIIKDVNYKKSSHSVYDLKYHLIFCTKYRYRILTGQIAIRVREVIRAICSANYVDIASGSMSPDHIHLLLSIPPSTSVSKIVQYIKGKSARKLLMEFELLRKRYWGQTYSQRLLYCQRRQCQCGRCAKIYRKSRRASSKR